MTELDSIILRICEREEKSGCYDCEVAGIKVYNLIRFKVRNIILQAQGHNFVENYEGVSFLQFIKSLTISTFQLSKIRLERKKYNTLFYPFLRLDCVEGN